MNASTEDPMGDIVSRLEMRAFHETGAGSGNVRWWLAAIADEIEAWAPFTDQAYVAEWLRSQIQATPDSEVPE